MPDEAAGSILTRKLGPLPGWAWLGLATGGAYLYLRGRHASTGSASTGSASTGYAGGTYLPVSSSLGGGYSGGGYSGGGYSGGGWLGYGGSGTSTDSGLLGLSSGSSAGYPITTVAATGSGSTGSGSTGSGSTGSGSTGSGSTGSGSTGSGSTGSGSTGSGSTGSGGGFFTNPSYQHYGGYTYLNRHLSGSATVLQTAEQLFPNASPSVALATLIKYNPLVGTNPNATLNSGSSISLPSSSSAPVLPSQIRAGAPL